MPFQQRTGPFKRIYKLLLIASSFGCTLWPFVISSASLLLLPVKIAAVPVTAVVVLAVVPIPEEPPAVIRKLLKDAIMAAKEWLQIKVKYNPEQFQEIWWWLDIRPATRENFHGLLKDGKTVCLTPGGIQECLYMRPGHEVAYLTQRLGFIRIALRHGAPLVPAFAFGQCDMYKYIKPGPPIVPESVITALSRKIGFVPFLFWGWCGTTIPYDSAMTVVLGDPIATAEDQTDEPTDELCKEYNKKFVANLQDMFEEHKAEAGYPDLELHVM